MSKPRVFVLPEQVKGNEIAINGPDVNHIKNVLRLKVGDGLVVCDDSDFEYEAEILELSSSHVKATILEKREIKPALPQVTLIQAIPKGSKMDTIIRQATELGVYGIMPAITSRTVVRLDQEKARKKQERWQKIAREAAEQSQRPTVPRVSSVLTGDGLLEMIGSFDTAIVFWEEEREMFAGKVLNAAKCGNIGVLIGPEGGFSKDEVKDFEKRGGRSYSLGRQVLRVETASVVALGIVFYELAGHGGADA